MATLRGLAFALLAVTAASAEACRVAPAGQLIDAADQVAQASDVALAQVIGATPLGGDAVEYQFLVLDQLAGPARKVFTLNGRAATSYDQDTTFDDHAAFAFWARGGGRTMNGTDCVIHPSFVVGSTYLVFLGPSPTWRSFEKIDMAGGAVNPDDKWLAYVKDALASRQISGQQAGNDWERVGRFLYGFQRIVAGDTFDVKTLAAQHAPDALLRRAGPLAAKYEHIVKHGADVPDAELEATLREAAAVKAMLTAWRSNSSSSSSNNSGGAGVPAAVPAP